MFDLYGSLDRYITIFMVRAVDTLNLSFQASGVKVSEEVKQKYDDIKKKKCHRYLVFYIKDEKTIAVEKIGKFCQWHILDLVTQGWILFTWFKIGDRIMFAESPKLDFNKRSFHRWTGGIIRGFFAWYLWGWSWRLPVWVIRLWIPASMRRY